MSTRNLNTPLRVPEMIAAMRRGLGRSPGLIPVPAAALRAYLSLARKPELSERLTGSLGKLVCRSGKLHSTMSKPFATIIVECSGPVTATQP
jgi:hypothetical protein